VLSVTAELPTTNLKKIVLLLDNKVKDRKINIVIN